MAKLIYCYGVMNCGKSIDLLKTAHNYEEENYKVEVMKPSLDTRDKEIKSRIGLSHSCKLISPEDNIVKLLDKNIDVLFIDEAQFLSKEQIDQLTYIVDDLNIFVYCYGLKLNFLGEFFEGSKRLFEVSDKLIELKNICHYCNKKATHNLLFNNGVVVDHLDSDIAIENENNKYESCCRKHFNHILGYNIEK